MATVTKGRTFVSGETVTPSKLNDLVDLATVTSIVDADVSASAAIALSKLATGALPTAITVASANIVDGTIVAADIASGAVTQAKLATNVTTTGPAFRAQVASSQSINNAVETVVTLTTEDFDATSSFSSSRFSPSIAGYYQINFGVRFQGSFRAQVLVKRNNQTIASGNFSDVATFDSRGSDVVYMDGATHYLELIAYHEAGSARNVVGGYLSGFLARAA